MPPHSPDGFVFPNDILERAVPDSDCSGSVRVLYTVEQQRKRPPGNIQLMYRRTAGLLLLPISLIFLMTTNVHSDNHARQRSPRRLRPNASGRASRKFSAEQQKWVDATVRSMMSGRKSRPTDFQHLSWQLHGQRFCGLCQMLHSINDLHVGGFINVTHISPLGIVKSQVYPTAVLTNQLQAKSKLPLLIGADFERGTAMRLEEGTSFPTQMALAAGGNPRDAYTMGKVTALESRAAGVHWIYAPVADVNNNPGNPIINTRSFGEDPVKVAEYVFRICAWCSGEWRTGDRKALPRPWRYNG